MRLEIRGEYPANWRALSSVVKQQAGHRCVRCRHAFHPFTGAPMPCDAECDARRCRGRLIAARGGSHNLTVHHLDGDKGNSAWWNLLSLCNACHLSVQARVIVVRPWLFAHSDWFIPYVCGFYASFYGGRQITREQATAQPDRWLRLNPASAIVDNEADSLAAGRAVSPLGNYTE